MARCGDAVCCPEQRRLGALPQVGTTADDVEVHLGEVRIVLVNKTRPQVK